MLVHYFVKRQIQRCMSFTEKIVVGKISVKVMHFGKVMYIAFTENSFKFMYFATFAVLKHTKGTTLHRSVNSGGTGVKIK